MRIIDKKKDYYDYLVGKFGIDSNITLDRRNFTMLKDNQKFRGIINGDEWFLYNYPVRIDVGIGNKLYHFSIQERGQKVKPITSSKDSKNPNRIPFVEDRGKGLPLIRISIRGRFNFNREILIDNVILQGTFIPSFINSEEAYMAIYEYLSSMKDIDIIDSRTDKEKLLSAGFDSKTSFRKM